MISAENLAANNSASDTDFTVGHYRKLLQLATAKWMIAPYDAIPWGARFVLWRHDIDYSLNRSLALAHIEHEAGVKASYFVNPHSEFYNLAELAQHRIMQRILSFGHDLGLHFDAAFYDIASEADLDRLVAREALYLKQLFGIEPVAFSFHNPVATHLACEREHYGGLVNCYSQRFKHEVAYCSDSNGYWRFRRLHDVLTAATDPCLQVLTHPEWWQKKPMPPRQRVFRCVHGRSAAAMRFYDAALREHGRLNHAGAAASLRFLDALQPQLFELCDDLWNRERFQTLYLELWRLHESQIARLCQYHLCREWQVPAAEVNAFFDEAGSLIDGWRIFDALFEHQWIHAAGVAEAEYKAMIQTRNRLIHGCSTVGQAELEAGCVCLCQLIQNLGVWGQQQDLGYDWLTNLGTIGLPTDKTGEGCLGEKLEEGDSKILDFSKKWELFKSYVLNGDVDEWKE